MEYQEIIVVISGGCLTAVYAQNEKIKVTLVDYDNITSDGDHPFGSDEQMEAHIKETNQKEVF
jgi:hypothetical protein